MVKKKSLPFNPKALFIFSCKGKTLDYDKLEITLQVKKGGKNKIQESDALLPTTVKYCLKEGGNTTSPA
jgi:hypothetical protein